MSLMPGSGYCYTCNSEIDDSCGGETRNCAACRNEKYPMGWA